MKAKKIQLPITEDFQNLIDLLAVFSEASNRLEELKPGINRQVLEILDEEKDDYTRAQEAATQAEAAMEKIVLRHPEWFTDKKTIKTPYGTVALKDSTALSVVNEEATIVRIELQAQKLFPGNGPEEIRARDEYVARYIRTSQSLNKEVLEKEDDAFLKQLGIGRIEKQNFSAKPATLDLGKAVKEAAVTESTTETVNA